MIAVYYSNSGSSTFLCWKLWFLTSPLWTTTQRTTFCHKIYIFSFHNTWMLWQKSTYLPSTLKCKSFWLYLLSLNFLPELIYSNNLERFGNYNFRVSLKKNFMAPFMDGFQLSQSFRASIRRQFTFYYFFILKISTTCKSFRMSEFEKAFFPAKCN